MEDLFQRNAREINRLHERIHATVKTRDDNQEAWEAWSNACSDFHEQYDQLAFPGGLDGAYDKILEGDKITIDTAITFLECRPYFFRSGYIYQQLIRKLKRAQLEGHDKKRFDQFMIKHKEYKSRKKGNSN